jgi:hypothetical protein
LRLFRQGEPSRSVKRALRFFPVPSTTITDATDALEKFGRFHDWYIDIIATRNEADP